MISYGTQAEAFHHEMVALIKKYQFRDRNEITCCGVSVSQCYVLELLHFQGALTMRKLAEQMHLSVSTITRVVEGLVKKGYVHREEDAEDRRVRRVGLTGEGQGIFEACWNNVMQSEEAILEQFPVEHRAMLIEFLQQLNQATTCWQAGR